MNHLTIQNWLTRNAKNRPEHTAIVFKEQRRSYRELNSEVNRLVRAFQAAGVTKGDRIATCLANSLEVYEIYWACAKLGAVAVPLSPLLRGKGLHSLLNNSDAKILVTTTSMVEQLEPAHRAFVWLVDDGSYARRKAEQPDAEPNVERVDGAEAAHLMYSSGTTGEPKGIVISHSARALYGSVFANSFRMTPESVALHSGSLVFNGAFLMILTSMYLGATFVLEESLKPYALVTRMKEEGVSHTVMVPSQITAALAHPDFTRAQMPKLEYILSVGSPLLNEYKVELNERFSEIFYELYGLTEGFMTILDKTRAKDKLGSVGCPPPFTEMRIVDDDGRDVADGQIGEIVGRGPMLMTEYFKNPVKTAEAFRDGWLHTGDLGFKDADGFLTLTGRKKDLIISGGVNVYPVDIEEVVIQHPNVRDVAVFGVPCPERTETPVAAVVLNGDMKVVDSAGLRTWVNERLHARYQKIHDVWIVEELPRNIAGKILKAQVKQSWLDYSVGAVVSSGD